MEDVRSAADEGDIAGMSVEDAICLVYVIGVKDDTLRDKLSEVPDPNIEKFTAIMKSYVQSKITRREIASACSSNFEKFPGSREAGKTAISFQFSETSSAVI